MLLEPSKIRLKLFQETVIELARSTNFI